MVTGTQDAHGEPPELGGMMDGDWNRIGASQEWWARDFRLVNY